MAMTMASTRLSSSLNLPTTELNHLRPAAASLPITGSLIENSANSLKFGLGSHRSHSSGADESRKGPPLQSLRCSTAADGGLQAVLDLPKNLRDIVLQFVAVQDSRQRYQQLLCLGGRLKQLDLEHCVRDNQVPGCVASKVWVVARFGDMEAGEDEDRVYFRGYADSMHTRGLAGLLIEGLSGCTSEEIMSVTPDFFVILGMWQRMTPSRTNGFLNLLKLMQRKTLELQTSRSSQVINIPMALGTIAAGEPQKLALYMKTVNSFQPALEVQRHI